LPYQAGKGAAVLVFILGPASATFFIALGGGSTRGRAAVAGSEAESSRSPSHG
jgi:hypothetical protein